MRRHVSELLGFGARAKQRVATFQISEATVYNLIKQDEMDRGGTEGFSAGQAADGPMSSASSLTEPRRRRPLRTTQGTTA